MMDDEAFKLYRQSVRNYVENDILPENKTEQDLIKSLRDCSDEQRVILNSAIERVLPRNLQADVSYVLDHMSPTLKWAILIGIGGGAVGRQLSENLIVPIILSIATFSVTFAGKLLYRGAQISDRHHAMENRAQKFLELLEALSSSAICRYLLAFPITPQEEAMCPSGFNI